MRFDVERNAYIALCARADFEWNTFVDLSFVVPPQDGQKQVVVSPYVFEQYRLWVDALFLYEVQFWVAVAYEHPDLAMLEWVSGFLDADVEVVP
jgi:hypothetical protein